MWRDEFLAQSIVLDQRGETAAGEASPLYERSRNALKLDPERVPKWAIKVCSNADSAFLYRPLCERCLSSNSRLWPSIARAVRLTITARPDPAHVGGSAFVGSLGHRRQRLNPGPEANRSFAHLPAFDPEDALNRVLVEPQYVRHRALAEHGLDLCHEAILSRGCGLYRPVVHSLLRYCEPLRQFANRDGMSSACSPWRIFSITSRPGPETGTAVCFWRVTPASPRHRFPASP